MATLEAVATDYGIARSKSNLNGRLCSWLRLCESWRNSNTNGRPMPFECGRALAHRRVPKAHFRACSVSAPLEMTALVHEGAGGLLGALLPNCDRRPQSKVKLSRSYRNCGSGTDPKYTFSRVRQRKRPQGRRHSLTGRDDCCGTIRRIRFDGDLTRPGQRLKNRPFCVGARNA